MPSYSHSSARSTPKSHRPAKSANRGGVDEFGHIVWEKKSGCPQHFMPEKKKKKKKLKKKKKNNKGGGGGGGGGGCLARIRNMPSNGTLPIAKLVRYGPEMAL